jgi:hypothetical protein
MVSKPLCTENFIDTARVGEDEATANDGYARKQGRLLVVSTFALALLSGIVTFMSLS